MKSSIAGKEANQKTLLRELFGTRQIECECAAPAGACCNTTATRPVSEDSPRAHRGLTDGSPMAHQHIRQMECSWAASGEPAVSPRAAIRWRERERGPYCCHSPAKPWQPATLWRSRAQGRTSPAASTSPPSSSPKCRSSSVPTSFQACTRSKPQIRDTSQRVAKQAAGCPGNRRKSRAHVVRTAIRSAFPHAMMAPTLSARFSDWFQPHAAAVSAHSRSRDPPQGLQL